MITIKQVAERIGVSEPTVYRIRRDDPTFPKPYRYGRQVVRYAEDEIEAWLASRREPREAA